MSETNIEQDPTTIIHIGLHKTATRFFQHQVFAPLAEQGILFNPPELMPAVHALYREPGNAELFKTAQQALTALREKYPNRTLLISKPDIPGDMYETYREHPENLALLHRLFPEAHLLYVPRHPVDWLLSAYRQSLVKGAGGPIETFLNFRQGAFQPKPAAFVNGMRNVDALSFPVASIYEEAVKHYGEEQVSVMCFEHVRTNKDRVFEHLCKLLGIEEIAVAEPEKIKNRSFSGLAIKLFCNGNGSSDIKNTADSIPRFVQRWIHRPRRKLRANLIKHGWDSLIYKDWDLLARNDMRNLLTQHYDAEYNRILTVSKKLMGLD